MANENVKRPAQTTNRTARAAFAALVVSGAERALIQAGPVCVHSFVVLIVLAFVQVTAGQGRGEETPSASGWGDLQMRFTLEGEPPPPRKLDTSKEPACANLVIVDETLVVGSNGGIKNVFVWLVSEPKSVHADIEAAAKRDAKIHVQGCRYEPRATVLAVGQLLHVKNLDPFGHYSNLDFQESRISPAIPSGGDQSRAFSKSEAVPVPIECHIHPWMKAYLLVRPNRYASVSNRDGMVTIPNLPVGNHTFCAWSERYLQGAKISGKDAGWKKGRFEAEIKDGETTRFDVTVSPKVILGIGRAEERQ